MRRVDAFRRFLSRLCGGEAVFFGAKICFDFLSRLCGGEADAISNLDGGFFLSRLCGGEAA